jgi:DNA-binding NarL/FixJ family response regulator
VTSVSTFHASSPVATVCLVEDHPLLRDLLCDLMDDSGLQVLAAVGTMRDGEAAIFEYRPDVAIIDNRLPDGRGIDLIRILARSTPKVALVLHSGTATHGDASEALQAGASAVILKSIRGHSLIEAIRICHRSLRPELASVLSHRESQGGARPGRSDRHAFRSPPSFRPRS